MTLKVCSICDQPREAETDFYTYGKRDGTRGLMAKCKACHLAVAKRWNDANPERVRKNNRVRNKRLGRVGICRKYGLNAFQVMIMESASGGLCAICREFHGEELFVDHDHETGEVRGLLCRRCNTAIGLLGDDVRRMLRAIVYVRRGGLWKSDGSWKEK